MKKRFLVLATVLAVVLSISAHAATPRAVLVLPALSFNGTTANCTVRINGNTSSDTISATIELLEGSTSVETWTVSGTGYVYFTDTASATKNKTYTLNVDAVVNGKAYPTASISQKCS